jgi:hypothetical protein
MERTRRTESDIRRSEECWTVVEEERGRQIEEINSLEAIGLGRRYPERQEVLGQELGRRGDSGNTNVVLERTMMSSRERVARMIAITTALVLQAGCPQGTRAELVSLSRELSVINAFLNSLLLKMHHSDLRIEDRSTCFHRKGEAADSVGGIPSAVGI